MTSFTFFVIACFVFSDTKVVIFLLFQSFFIVLFQNILRRAFEAGGAEVGGDETAFQIDAGADEVGMVHEVEGVPDLALGQFHGDAGGFGRDGGASGDGKVGGLRDLGGLDGRAGRGEVSAHDVPEHPDGVLACVGRGLGDGIGSVDPVVPSGTAAAGTTG